MVIQRTEWLAALDSGGSERSSHGAFVLATAVKSWQSYRTSEARAPRDRGVNGSRAMGTPYPDFGFPHASDSPARSTSVGTTEETGRPGRFDDLSTLTLMRTCVRMTSQGTAYSRFHRAIGTRNMRIITAAAAELPRIGVAEAAAILLVIHEVEADAFDRAALRWLAKLCSERSRAGLADVAEAAAALNALDESPADGRRRLEAICRRAGLWDAARVFAA
jgi:hypothetical protein